MYVTRERTTHLIAAVTRLHRAARQRMLDRGCTKTTKTQSFRRSVSSERTTTNPPRKRGMCENAKTDKIEFLVILSGEIHKNYIEYKNYDDQLICARVFTCVYWYGLYCCTFSCP